MDYTIYTDGAYSNLHNEGAFAFIILQGDKEVKRMCGKVKDETNNRAEIKAIIAGVWNLPDDATNVQIISDSMYALNTLSGQWGRKTNLDLFDVWERKVKKKFKGLKIEWMFVRGHSGDFYNEECDKICSDTLGYDVNKEFEKYKKIK